MWFQKHKQVSDETNRLLKQLSEKAEKLQRQADSLSGQQADSAEMLKQTLNRVSQQMSSLEQRYGESEKIIRRQSDSFEDLLDEIQDQQKEQNSQSGLLKENQQREQAFLALISCIRDQMYLLEQKMTEDDSLSEEKKTAWIQQFLLMNQEAARYMTPCGLTETGAPGEPVDYEIHNILNIIETQDESKANTIAKVYRRGLFCNGRLIKKADVAAYKQSRQGEPNDT